VAQYSVDDAPSAEPPIKITPASPVSQSFRGQDRWGANVAGRSELSLRRPRGQNSAGRRVSKILKTQVHRGQERISSISKIVTLGPKHGLSHLRKATSAPGRHSQISRRPPTNRPRQISIPRLARALTKHHLSIREGESRTAILPLTNRSRSLHLPAPLSPSRRLKYLRNWTTVPRRTEG